MEQSGEECLDQLIRDGADSAFSAPLRELIRREPVRCIGRTPVQEALALMDANEVGSIVVTDDDRCPCGIFTLYDLLHLVVTGKDLATPIQNVMNSDPVVLPAHAPTFEAALAMTRHGIRHVIVVEEERLQGVVSERDLFAQQRVGLSQLSSSISRARNSAELAQAAGDIRTLTVNLLNQGMGSEQLTRLIATLNDHLTGRILELEAAACGVTDIEWCWLALGSEGRHEQTLLTDQDNALIFRLPDAGDADVLRERLLPFARKVNETLARCGFPLCKGEVMASNPQWCCSLEEWQDLFSGWIHRGDGQTLLNASIFFDFRPLYGEAELARELRDWLNGHVRANWQFLRKMVQNALANSPALGFVRDFALDHADADHPHSLDLKLHGITIFVDAARIFALAAGVSATATVERLRETARVWRKGEQLAEGRIHAFQFLQKLRLRRHRQMLKEGRPLTNRLDPDELDSLDRNFLKEALRQAKRLQDEMEKNFQF
jgi:CBS domain-containing protein